MKEHKQEIQEFWIDLGCDTCRNQIKKLLELSEIVEETGYNSQIKILMRDDFNGCVVTHHHIEIGKEEIKSFKKAQEENIKNKIDYKQEQFKKIQAIKD